MIQFFNCFLLFPQYLWRSFGKALQLSSWEIHGNLQQTICFILTIMQVSIKGEETKLYHLKRKKSRKACKNKNLSIESQCMRWFFIRSNIGKFLQIFCRCLGPSPSIIFFAPVSVHHISLPYSFKRISLIVLSYVDMQICKQ